MKKSCLSSKLFPELSIVQKVLCNQVEPAQSIYFEINSSFPL